MTVRNDQNGSTLLLIMIVGLLIAFTSMSTFTTSTFSIAKVSQRKRSVSAFNIAEAGKEHAIAKVSANINLITPHIRDTVLRNVGLENGSYTVSCSTNAQKDSIWIRSVGSINDNSITIDVICIPRMVSKKIDPLINAAVSTRSSFWSKGNIRIDGNNWCYKGDSIIDNGISGVCYNGVLNQKGNSKIGGAGFPPERNATSPAVDSEGDDNPKTPEEALGLNPGDLDDYIIDTIPSGPLNFQNKIVYISPPDNTRWIDPDFGGSSGILIFHNETWTAQLKNIHGNFKGIIIADKINHINANALIYGAIFTLSSTEGDNVFGMGDSDIRYSKGLIDDIMDAVLVDKPGGLQEVVWKQE